MTHNRIHKLSPLLINQIAAGEVVTRPASVVKELIENAIDANATHIRVNIEQGGLGLIQVIDNGDGIHAEDMLLAITRHATSKLADVGELTGIHSLGFRGEALASIAAVSHLTLSSSHDNSGIGQQLQVSGSDVSQADINPIVKSQGTTVTVRSLYFNIPARRSHLKSIATEFAHIEQVIQRLAISFPQIQLELFHQNKQRFCLDKISRDNPKSLVRLEQALSISLSPYAVPFEIAFEQLLANSNQSNQQDKAKVTGWLFYQQHHSSIHASTFPKLIYINHRLVTDFAISQVLQKSARQQGIEQLGYALFFELPSEWVNVNIHPSKQQVKIQPLTNILALLNHAACQTLELHKIKTPVATTTNSQLASIADNLANSTVRKIETEEFKSKDTASESVTLPPGRAVRENTINYNVENNEVAVTDDRTLTVLQFLSHQQFGNLVLLNSLEGIYLVKQSGWDEVQALPVQQKIAYLNQTAIRRYAYEELAEFMLANVDSSQFIG